MDLSPRLVAVLAFVALLPYGIYAGTSGEVTPVMAAVGVVDVVLVAVSILVMFGPAPGDTEHATAH